MLQFPLMRGQKLGNCEIVEKLGESGMGEISNGASNAV
jgi:hypothetical protein